MSEKKTMTARILEEIEWSREAEEKEDEAVESADERWLVSYADMMTLLFGLFVMLYSMANRFESAQASIAKHFDKTVTESISAGAPVVTDPDLARKALAQKVENLSTENARLKDELRAKIAQLQKPVETPSPITVVMKWSTASHDIDLVVKDPEGMVFDYKNRKYPQHPGNLILDSRHGPGAEVWQSDRVIAGIYEVTYFFYNSYGNNEPAKVSASILTSRGSLDLPETSMAFERNRRTIVRFKAGLDGKVDLIK